MITNPSKQLVSDEMPLDDFMRLSNDQPFELIAGERIEKMPNGFLHGEILHIIFRLLDAFVSQHALGRVYMEMTFIYAPRSNWVRGSRIPDIMFYEKTRFETYKQTITDKNLPLAIVPNLIIEILSPTDNLLDVQDRIMFDFDNGVKQIWLIDPDRRGALVYLPDANRPTRYGEDGVLSAPAILPNFELHLTTVWA